VASLALMVAVVFQLERAAVLDWVTLLIAFGSLALLYWKRVNAVWLMLAGAAIGIVVKGVI
jgi:chromate transporter